MSGSESSTSQTATTKSADLKPRLTVIGVGGAGCNAINNMIAAGLDGVDFVVANTDAQALAASSAEHRVQLGATLTEGLGAGSRPEIGEAAAEEAMEELRAQVKNSHMVFIAAGMGGGTGTGAAAVIARAAKEQGILTVGVVTKPFQFEGARRMRIAEAGIEELKKYVDTLIVIPNQNLFRIANNKTTFAEAFVLADQVLYSGVACIVDLIIKEGLINLDFADVRTVMSGMGTAMMGTGEASGERRAIEAAEEAIANPLLDDVSLSGAKGLLLSITGGPDLTLFEVDEAASRVREEVDNEANIIVGATFDQALGDKVRVSIVASGMARMGAVQTPPRGAQAAGGGRQPAAEPARAAGIGAPFDPNARRHDAGDMQRRLSEALQYGDDGVGGEFEHRPAPVYGHGLPQHDSDGVTIEEGPPPLASASPRQGWHQGPAAPQPAMFSPAPPTEVRGGRDRMRRTPDVSDFEPFAQNAYHAKTGGRAPAAEPAPRKPGLLERLTGRARRITERDSDEYAKSEPQLQGDSGSGGSNWERDDAHDGRNPRGVRDAGLPVFISRERK